jgi:hypothetical protein
MFLSCLGPAVRKDNDWEFLLPQLMLRLCIVVVVVVAERIHRLIAVVNILPAGHP